MDYAQLKPGQSLGPYALELSRDAIGKYIQAVGDDSPLYAPASLVPPTALAALGLRGIIQELSIPGGTLQVGQEMDLFRAVETGQTLTCLATVAQNAVRGPWRFLTVDFYLEDVEKTIVMKGKSTILLPL